MQQQTYSIKGMDCADCALKIEKGVRQLHGVEKVNVDFATGLLHLSGQADPEQLRRRVEVLGYSIEEKSRTASQRTGFWTYLISRPETRLSLVGGAILAISLLLGLAGVSTTVVTAVQVAALIIAGFPVARSALVTLWVNRDFSINLLMTIAAVGAVIIGETAEAATLIFLFTVSEALEGFTADRARSVLSEMGEIVPARALLLRGGQEQMVPVEELRVGDEIVVRAGERIPMDGAVSSGTSEVNQAAITGESMPADKAPGDSVFAGTVNGSGVLTIQVTKLSQDTTIQRIIHLIEQASSVRAPTQRLIDRFAQVYTPLVILLAVLVASIPPLFFGQPFFNTPDGSGWLYRSLAMLVIACPCALVISAPVAIVSAITAAARRGVLFKGGVFLEGLAGIRTFAFDKTGTLTHGQPVVTEYRSVDCSDPAAIGADCPVCGDVLALASALERRSAHPLAQSVVSAAAAQGLALAYPTADAVVALAGSGLQGRVNGKLATVGSHSLFDREHPHHESLCNWVMEAENRGQTTMLVCDGDRVRGFIAAADSVRPNSRQTLAGLRQLGKENAMLTGDNPTVAGAVAGKLDIRTVRAGLLPEDKVSAVRGLEAEYGPVAMVGDGINDAPALAAASIGIAVGGAGSAQAMETADIVLMAGDIDQLPFAVRLSAFTRRLIRQNVVISLITKLAFLILAAAGLTSLWLAVLADVGVSLVVTANAMRARRFEAR